MKQSTLNKLAPVLLALCALLLQSMPARADGLNILDATMGEEKPTPEVSTAEVRQILKDGSAVILDSRRLEQYVAGHIPGVAHIDLPEGSPEYLAELERLLGGKDKAVVLYCNGPNCGASRRLGAALVEGGFTNVRRYQLGIPMWRTMGGPTVMELAGIVRIFDVDRSAVYFDARSPAEFARGSLPGAHNVPAARIDQGVLDNAPKPNQDLNTRIVIFGKDGAQARALAEAMGESPYHNVNYYPGNFETLQKAIHGKLHKH